MRLSHPRVAVICFVSLLILLVVLYILFKEEHVKRINHPTDNVKDPFHLTISKPVEQELTADSLVKLNIASKKLEQDDRFSYPEIYTVNPSEAYEDYLRKANAGAAADQFRLSLILRRCVGAPTEEVILRMESTYLDNDTVESFVASMRLKHEECKGLGVKLQGANVKDLLNGWRHAAAVQGYALAELGERFEINENIDKKKGMELLMQSFTDIKANSAEEIVLLEFVARYYNQFAPDDRDLQFAISNGVAPNLDVDRMAWNYLVCKKNPICTNDYDTYLKENYYEYEVDEVVNRVDELESHIANKNWDGLGLP